MAHHVLKAHPKPFQAILERRKRFELRKNDRDYAVGDTLQLQEWDPERQVFSGSECVVTVLYMLTAEEASKYGNPLAPGFCCMSISDPGTSFEQNGRCM